MEQQGKPRVNYAAFIDAQRQQEQSYAKGSLGQLIQRVIDDVASQAGTDGVQMHGVTHLYSLKFIQREAPIAKLAAVKLTRSDFIDFVKWRRASGVSAATANASLGHVVGVLKYAAATWEDIDLVKPLAEFGVAKLFMVKRRMIGKANARKRRVTDAEVALLLNYYAKHPGRVLRMQDVIAFCLASSRRRGEVCRITWGDVDFEKKVYWVRDLKHPTKKKGNDKPFVLYPVIEQILRRQPRLRPDDPSERIFPFIPESLTQSFIAAKKGIAEETGDDTILTLRLHDHRAEAISRWLLEMSAGDVRICVSGHNNEKTIEKHYDRRDPLEVAKAKHPRLMEQPAPSPAR